MSHHPNPKPAPPSIATLPPQLMRHFLHFVDPITFVSMTTLNRSWRLHSKDPQVYRAQLRKLAPDTLGHGYSLDTIVESDLDNMQRTFAALARSNNWPAYAESKVKSIMTGQALQYEAHDFSTYASAYASAYVSAFTSPQGSPTFAKRHTQSKSGLSEPANSISAPSSRPDTAMSRLSLDTETPSTGPPTINSSNVEKDQPLPDMNKPLPDIVRPVPIRPSTPNDSSIAITQETPRAGPSKVQEEKDAAAGLAAPTPTAQQSPVDRLRRSVSSSAARLRSVSLGARTSTLNRSSPTPLDEDAGVDRRSVLVATPELQEVEQKVLRRRTTIGVPRSLKPSGDALQLSLSAFVSRRTGEESNFPIVAQIPEPVPLPEAPTPSQVESLRRRNTLVREDPFYRPSGTAPKAAAGAYRRSFSTSNLPIRPLSVSSFASLAMTPPSFRSTPSLAASILEEPATDSSDAASGLPDTYETNADGTLRLAHQRRNTLSRLSKIESVASGVHDARSRSRSASGKFSQKQNQSHRGHAGRGFRKTRSSEESSNGDPCPRDDARPLRSKRMAARIHRIRSKLNCVVM